MKFDSDENGGKLTNRDVWNATDHTPLKLVVAKVRDVDGEVFDGRYVGAATRGVKFQCDKSGVKPWFIEWRQDPCRYCEIDNKDECDQSDLKMIEDDVLLLDFLRSPIE